MAKKSRADERRHRKATESFRRFLHRRGLRTTPVRNAILRAILDRSGHFDVDELFFDLRGRIGELLVEMRPARLGKKME